jgi:hypothetical protein
MPNTSKFLIHGTLLKDLRVLDHAVPPLWGFPGQGWKGASMNMTYLYDTLPFITSCTRNLKVMEHLLYQQA